MRLIELDDVFTPGGRYRDSMRIDGKRVRVRQRDGVHLNATGRRAGRHAGDPGAATRPDAAVRRSGGSVAATGENVISRPGSGQSNARLSRRA